MQIAKKVDITRVTFIDTRDYINKMTNLGNWAT